LTFANAAAKVGDGDSGRSRAPTDDRDNFETECLPSDGHELALPTQDSRSGRCIDSRRADIAELPQMGCADCAGSWQVRASDCLNALTSWQSRRP